MLLSFGGLAVKLNVLTDGLVRRENSARDNCPGPVTDTDCKKTKMCLRSLPESSLLRTHNAEQLRCLNVHNEPGECANWKVCLSAQQVDSVVLQAMLEAALLPLTSTHVMVGGGLESSAQQNVGSEVTGECGRRGDPANDAYENWKCGCVNQLHAACDQLDHLATRRECLKGEMCASDAVCDTWKQQKRCQTSLISKDNVSMPEDAAVTADTIHARRQPPGSISSTEPVGLLDNSLSGKACTKASR